MPTIDHDPNERRPLKGEFAFVAIATTITLAALGAALKWVANSQGMVVFLLFCAACLIGLFALAFRLEARQRRTRERQRRLLGLHSDQ